MMPHKRLLVGKMGLIDSEEDIETIILRERLRYEYGECCTFSVVVVVFGVSARMGWDKPMNLARDLMAPILFVQHQTEMEAECAYFLTFSE